MTNALLATGSITIGDHAATTHVFGMTLDLDIIWASGFAALVVLGLGFLLIRKVTPGVPGKVQLFWEVLLEQVQDLTDSSIGPEGRSFVPLGIAIFLFILVCNWMELIPSGHNPEWLPAPTSDINLPLAMGITVIAIVHYNSIKARGFGGYIKHYFQPYAFLAPINVIEEITKPITLTLRLFGNLFSGGLMVTVVIALAPIYAIPFFETWWKPFDVLLLGTIQAFIFALLTILYLGMGMATDAH